MPRKTAGSLDEVRAGVRKTYMRGTRSRKELINFNNLTSSERWIKEEQACLLKAAGFSYTYIGEAIGQSRGTVKSWFADAEMQARTQAFQKDFIDGAVKLVRTYAIELFEMLVEIARDGQIDPRVRIQAITECLDRMGLAKVNKSESAATKTIKSTVDIVDKTGLLTAMKEAPPEVQQEMAQKLDDIMGLVAEHSDRDVTNV